MTNPDVRAAAEFDDDTLSGMLNDCYADYFVPIRLDPATFRALVETQDVDLTASRVVLAGGAPAGIVLLARRGARAWIGGMGVRPAARRRGLGRALMDAVLAAARGGGARRVELEVLAQNEGAARLYETLGFRDTRELWVLERAADPADRRSTPPAVPDAAVTVADCLADYDRLHAAAEPWQRARPVIERAARDLTAIGMRSAGRVEAAVLARVMPARASVLDIGIAAGAPPGALATVVATLVGRHGHLPMVCLNLPAGHAGAAALLEAGFQVAHRQREMALEW
jgi:ribosomal protein S18 acetylase RimI-like enzyme